MPFWVEAALTRNGKSIKDCLDYATVRQCLSLEDLSQFLSLQNSEQIMVSRFAYHSRLFSSWEKSADSSQRVELDSTVIPLSYSKDLGNNAILRLEQTPRQSDDQPFYRLVDADRDSCVLVVYPKFVEFTKTATNQLDVLRDLIKMLETYADLHIVARHPVFPMYLETLYRLNDGTPV